MKDLAYGRLRARLIHEFADDPQTVKTLMGAQGPATFALTLAHTYIRYLDLLWSFSLRDWGPGQDLRRQITEAAERRETALIEIMQFFELREVRGRALVVRRHGDKGLSVEYPRAGGAAAAA